MSTQSLPAAPAAAALAGAGPARTAIVRAVLAVGSLAVAGILVVRPGPARDDRSYAAVSAGRDAAWLGHLVECIGYAAVGVGLALAVCLLVRGRGAGWANVGAVLVGFGGVLFSAMAYAVGALDWYATATDALPAPAGTALLGYVTDNPARLAAADVAGFLLLTLGTLLVCVALWRSGSVPKAVPVVLAVLTAAQFVVPANRLLDVVQALLMLGFASVAWFVGRADARS